MTATTIIRSLLFGLMFAIVLVACGENRGTTPILARPELRRVLTSNTYASTVLFDGPVAYYRLDEAARSTTFADSSGNGHTAAISGSFTFGVTGAISGDSDTAVSGSANSSAMATIPVLGSSYTMEAWVKNTHHYEQHIENLSNEQLVMVQGQFKFGRNANGGHYLASPLATYADNQWHYVVATYDGTSKRLYVDGAQVATSIENASVSGTTVTLGAWYGGGYSWTGSLDEEAFYGKPLTATQVHNHYIAGSGGVQPSPSPSASATVQPSPSPSASATVQPSPSPSASATVQPSPSPSASASTISHIEMIIMENNGPAQIIGNPLAQYINNTLLPHVAYFNNYHALAHPSLPNYLALYSGSVQESPPYNDNCPLSFSGATLNSELVAAGKVFFGYSEEIPANGSTDCSGGNVDAQGKREYQGHHAPWIYFGEASVGLGYTDSAPPASFPDVSFIVPDSCDNMHDNCSDFAVRNGDRWLSRNVPLIESYNNTNNGLLVIVWDEAANSNAINQVMLMLDGPMVASGVYTTAYNHFNLLRTITNNFGLTALNPAGPITGAFH